MPDLPTASEVDHLRRVCYHSFGRGTYNVRIRVLRRGIVVTGILPNGTPQKQHISWRHVQALLRIHRMPQV